IATWPQNSRPWEGSGEMQTETLHEPADGVVRIPGCDDCQIVMMVQFLIIAAWFQQRNGAAGNRFGRVEPVNRPGRQPTENIGEKRIVCAGQNDDVGTIAILFDETGSNLFHNQRLVDLLATNMRFRHCRKLVSTDETNMALRSKGLNKVSRIGPPDSAGGSQHGNKA